MYWSSAEKCKKQSEENIVSKKKLNIKHFCRWCSDVIPHKIRGIYF